MIDYRQGTEADVQAVAEFAAEGMRPGLYAGHFDMGRVVAVAQSFLRQGWHLLAFDGARVVGVIAAVVQERLWFERCAAHVIACRAVAPGVGPRLIAALREWADTQMMVREVHFIMEHHARPSMARLLRRYGFTRQQVCCTYEKG